MKSALGFSLFVVWNLYVIYSGSVVLGLGMLYWIVWMIENREWSRWRKRKEEKIRKIKGIENEWQIWKEWIRKQISSAKAKVANIIRNVKNIRNSRAKERGDSMMVNAVYVPTIPRMNIIPRMLGAIMECQLNDEEYVTFCLEYNGQGMSQKEEEKCVKKVTDEIGTYGCKSEVFIVSEVLDEEEVEGEEGEEGDGKGSGENESENGERSGERSGERRAKKRWNVGESGGNIVINLYYIRVKWSDGGGMLGDLVKGESGEGSRNWNRRSKKKYVQ